MKNFTVSEQVTIIKDIGVQNEAMKSYQTHFEHLTMNLFKDVKKNIKKKITNMMKTNQKIILMVNQKFL